MNNEQFEVDLAPVPTLAEYYAEINEIAAENALENPQTNSNQFEVGLAPVPTLAEYYAEINEIAAENAIKTQQAMDEFNNIENDDLDKI